VVFFNNFCDIHSLDGMFTISRIIPFIINASFHNVLYWHLECPDLGTYLRFEPGTDLFL
jgi:hypothetical protein